MQPFILVDGSSYFFRAFHALPPLMNSHGQPTGAIYGVANMVRKLLEDYAPEYIAIVFDTKGKTFREELYPEYKAHRPPMPPELTVQFHPLIDILQAMGLPVLLIEGVEADDVIGTLAIKAQEQGLPVLISTGDKDFAQLVNENVTLLNTMTEKKLDPQGVVEKFGITPKQIIDYLALVGDSVDNVPGVPKCGPKTAVKWLQAYKTLDGVIKNAAQVSGKIGESLRASIPNLALSKELVTIKCDVDLPCELKDLTPKAIDTKNLLKKVQHLEFKRWMKDLIEGKFLMQNKAEAALSTHQEVRSYSIIQDEAAFNSYIHKLAKKESFCIDTETTSLDPLTAELIGISLATDENDAVYIPLQHTSKEIELPFEKVILTLKPILEDAAKLKIGQNLKYDYRVLQNVNINMQGLAFDTMLESYILNSIASRHDMETLALKYLGYQPLSYEKVTHNNTIPFADLPIKEAAFYSAEDADITIRLHQNLYPMLTEGQKKVFTTIEMPLVAVLGDMESYGVLIDKMVLASQGEELSTRIKALEKEAFDLVGRSFNLQSPSQLTTILFQEQGLPIVEKTPKGQPSTSESALQELAYVYRLPAVILEYRRLIKLLSTYIEALPKKIHPKTGRVHTSFNQAVTATGRLSSSDPNLQNIPIRRKEGRAIRRAFIAPLGSCILSADYSQIELRIMAHLSNDNRLCEAFKHKLDVHASTAAEIFGIDIADVSEEHRRRAKAINFGLIYGMSAFGLAKQLGIARQEAQVYVDKYFERFEGVLQYMERTRKLAKEQGYVETLFGRRLYLPEINSSQAIRRKAAERMAINAPMQGTAADLIKLAMIALHKLPKKYANLILQVHDELVFEVKEAEVNQVKAEVKDKMENAAKLNVPLVVSIGVGKDWESAH